METVNVREWSVGNAPVSQQSLCRFGAKSRPRRWCSRLGRLALPFSQRSPLRPQPTRQGGSGLFTKDQQPQAVDGGHLRAAARDPAVRPSFPRWLCFPCCVRAAASRRASPPADTSESSRPVSTPLFPASSSSLGAGLIHSFNSFIQPRWDFLGYFGCKLCAGCWVGPSAGSSRAASGAGTLDPTGNLKGRRPHVATGSPNRSASPAKRMPGSASRVGDPAGTELSPWTPRDSGFGAGARARVVTAAVSGFDLGAWHRSPRRSDPQREGLRSAGPRPKPGL